MPDCDYCGDAFDDEEAYLHHLRDAHEGELGAIDRRRVADLDGGDGGLSSQALMVVGAGAFVVAAVVYVVFFMGSGGGGGGGGTADGPIEAQSLPQQGDDAVIQRVETFPSQGRDHVPAGTQIDYARVPPLSGTHYGSAASAGFYEETPPLGALVHTLEHGAVIIYYDPSALTPEARASLEAWSSNFTGTWSSIVVAPNPNDDPRAPYVLTAWTHRLTMDEYDPEVVRAFAAEYLGRGPENQVR